MTCPHHDGAHVCSECPERFETDGAGFPHASACKGRIALKRCASCGRLVRRAHWDVRAWRCTDCVAESAR